MKFIFICNALKQKPNHFLDNFLYYDDDNEDLLFKELQKDKNISKSLINYMKNKY